MVLNCKKCAKEITKKELIDYKKRCEVCFKKKIQRKINFFLITAFIWFILGLFYIPLNISWAFMLFVFAFLHFPLIKKLKESYKNSSTPKTNYPPNVMVRKK